MICKIMSDYSKGLDVIITKLGKKYDLIFSYNALYISAEDIKINAIKRFFGEEMHKDCYVEELTENNLKYENPQIINWCKEKFVEQDIKRLEKNKQKQLQAINNFIKDFEVGLKKAMGGELDEEQE